MANLRGIEQRQEVKAAQLLRDTRTLGQRIADSFKNPSNVAVVLCLLAAIAFVYPAIVELIFVIGLILFLYTYTREQKLPVRMPKRSHVKDPNDLHPGTQKPLMARGIAFFGNDQRTNEEIWFNNDDLRTHVLIFGSTGSGKTESLVSFAFNALLHSSGFIYVDGKGDNSLYAKIFSMARSVGREDDLLLINFMTGARDIIGAQEKRLSNTMNPFCTGSSSMLSQLVTSLMSSGGSSGDSDMWKNRAIQFVESLMKILVYMRDQGHILLDANIIRNYFMLDKLEAIVADRIFLRDNQEPISLEDAPSIILEPMETYVYNLPGYNKERKGKQVSQVLEQHGFITMQLTRVFSSLADTYGHIIRTNLAEVDFKDVVLNRRILVVLLPALEKSPDELANLGKVIVASLKAMMAAGLGEEVEGEYRDVISRKPTNAPTPYLCILDEYGYYAVPGFAVVPAQARSLGFSAIFAGQDLPAFQKASKEEAASIGANTNIKICMKLEDPVETWDFFNKTAGEAYVTKVDSFRTDDSSMTNTYMDTKSASFEKRARIDLLDLKDQALGQAHIFFRSKIIRANLFFGNPQPTKRIRINQFLKVEPPTDSVLIGMQRRSGRIHNIIDSDDFVYHADEIDQDIKNVNQQFDQSAGEDLIEKGVQVLLNFHNQTEEEPVEEEVEQASVINIFHHLPLSDEDKAQLSVPNIDEFSEPFLAKAMTKKKMKSLEFIVTNQKADTSKIVDDVLKDMQEVTEYPTLKLDEYDLEKILESIDTVTNFFNEENEAISEEEEKN